MNPLKKLASQTAIYGLSTIVGRLLNYLLVPLLTYQFTDPRDFGVNTEFYAYISFLNVILTYGMETALFNFSVKEPDKNRVYSTALLSLLATTLVFVAPVAIFAEPIAEALRYPGHADYILWVALIIALDAVAAIPFAKLREQDRALRFASIKIVNILVNIGLTVFFVGLCKSAFDNPASAWHGTLGGLYDPRIGIGYVFIANAIANVVTALLLLPEFFMVKWVFDFTLWRRMLRYGLPLLVVGLAGMVNETLDRILLKYLLPPEQALEQVGIYGACYKISILMTIFIQAFRYAAEPFFFARSVASDAKQTYALVMNYFVITCAFIFLAVMMNIGWIQYFVGAPYRAGLDVVPILLLANLFLGVYFNLSIWYKLTGKTEYGAYLTLFGALITLTLNWYWIPRIGYMGSAWATLICYGSMAVLSYAIGRKHYPVDYDLKRVLTYPGLAIALYLLSTLIAPPSLAQSLVINNALLIGFLIVAFAAERKKFRAAIGSTTGVKS
ncbi:MAG: oligosaccharide flippase family protein [Gammaproteobacteria bacterium]|nr:oligosaccharide flippase family protein [Gammaproteobacteria bacterium]